jgi:hypothetical protein
MKLLFFSPSDTEVAEVEKQCVEAGIPCEIRHALHGRRPHVDFDEAELWICNDRDSHRALMLCVQSGVGFAKRPRGSHLESWSDLNEQNGEEVENPDLDRQSESDAELHHAERPCRQENHHRHARHRG